MAGGFFGGLSEGISQGMQRNQNADYQQKELEIQQQGQQMAQQRFQQTQAMDLYKQGVEHMSEFFDQWKIAHPDGDIKQAAAAMAPTKENLKMLAKNMGQSPDAIEGLWAGMIAAPPKTQTEAAMTAAKEQPKYEKLSTPSGGQELYGVKGGKATKIAETGQANLGGLEGDAMKDALARNSGLTADQLDMGASQLNDGNGSVLTNLGRGKQGGEAVKALRAWAAYKLIHGPEHLTPEEAAERVDANTLEYKATQAGASTLARREAQVIGASTTAMQTAPRVLEASKAVDRTEYKTLNSIILAAKEGTGDPNVVRLGIAVNTFINNYARAVGAGSAALTDAARGEAMANLQKAWSQGQIEAAIDQMLNKELPSEITGAKMGLKEFLQRKKQGSNTFATGETITGVGVTDSPKGISGTTSKGVRFSIEP